MASNTFTLKIPSIGTERSLSLVIKDEKKPFRIDLKAKNSDIKNGIFGFDKFRDNFNSICTSNIEDLKKEYNPLSEKILDEDYLPAWLSIRKDQTITLKLDWENKRKASAYNSIAFEEHDDFDISPASLKDEDEITISCKNNNSTPAQLLIKADGEIVGKSLNPALIDVKIKNEKPNTIDLSKHKDSLKNKGIIVKTPSYHYIEKDKKGQFVAHVMNEFKGDNTILNLFLVNRSCMVSGATGEDGGAFELVAGFSPTGTGYSYGILNEKNDLLPTAIAHEVMHSLGLHHTFETKSKHSFKDKSTKNYMDYNSAKEYTYKWQWQQLHEYRHLK